MDSNSETSEVRPAPTEVPVGQWIRPFVNYDQIPPRVSIQEYGGDVNQHFSKFAYFQTPGVGSWHVGLIWDSSKMENLEKNPKAGKDLVAVVIPPEVKVVKENEAPGIQKLIEARLLDLFVASSETPETDYEAYLRLPTGQTLRLEDIGSESIDRWSFDDEMLYQVLVPDAGNILEQLEVKIEKRNKKLIANTKHV